MRESAQVISPTKFLACLVTALIHNGHVEDAKSFAKLVINVFLLIYKNI